MKNYQLYLKTGKDKKKKLRVAEGLSKVHNHRGEFDKVKYANIVTQCMQFLNLLDNVPPHVILGIYQPNNVLNKTGYWECSVIITLQLLHAFFCRGSKCVIELEKGTFCSRDKVVAFPPPFKCVYTIHTKHSAQTHVSVNLVTRG